MKRKHSDESLAPNKKARIDYNIWISPSSIKNFMIKDPILDFFEISDKPAKSHNKNRSAIPYLETFTDALKYQGKLFEAEVYNSLKSRFKSKIININGSLLSDVIKSKFKRTKSAIAKGIPIIYQGILLDTKLHRYGIPDLIVRTDYINRIISTDTHVHDDEHSNYYCIIDIKYATLSLRSDGLHLRSTSWSNYYKYTCDL